MNICFAIDPKKKYRFHPKEIKELMESGKLEDKDAPYFIIQPLTARDAANNEDSISETSIKGKGEDTTMRLKSGSSTLNILLSGLKGWGNFRDVDGNELPWRDNGESSPRPDNLDYIPAGWRREIAEAIQEGKGMSEHEVKNSN